MNWQDKEEVKLGNIGEKIINDYLEKQGLVIYRPVTDNAHGFDVLVSRGKLELTLCEVKTKPKRKYFPDTGINHSVFKDYESICKKHNLKMFLFFVDFDIGQIYGDFLHVLSEIKRHVHEDKEYSYPKIELDKHKNRDIIYFFQPSMRKIADIPVEMVEEMRGLSKRKYDYTKSIHSNKNALFPPTPLLH